MNKKNKIIVISLFTCVIILTILALIGVNYKKEEPINNNHEEQTKPKITEEYTKAELKTIKEYDEYLFYDNNIAYYYDYGDKHIVYKNGKLLDTEIIEEAENSNYAEYIKFKKYDYYIDNDYEQFCIKDKSNNEIECYDSIHEIYNLQGSIDYLLLRKETKNGIKLYILNPNTGKLVDLSDTNITEINSNLQDDNTSEYSILVKEYDYLSACTNYEKCGLINYDGNIIIDFVYESLGYIDKNTILVSNNDKVGVINYKNEIKIPIQYDYIDVFGNFIIAIKDFKLSVYDKNYKVVASNIDVDASESETSYNFDANIDSTNNLYLYVYEDSINHVYLINNKIQRKIDSKGELQYLYDEDTNKIKYVTFNYEEANNVYLVFYDSDLYEYYKLNKEINSKIDYYVSIDDNLYNKNYYTFSILYDIESYNKYYYLDLINSKEIDEITALGKHFSNGYTYTITSGKLNIYKEKELLNSFDGYFTHLSEYEFLQTNIEGSKILLVDFQKELREVES